MAALAREAVSRNASRVEWAVLDWNEGALRFYRAPRRKAPDRVAALQPGRRGAGAAGGFDARSLAAEKLGPSEPDGMPGRLDLDEGSM